MTLPARTVVVASIVVLVAIGIIVGATVWILKSKASKRTVSRAPVREQAPKHIPAPAPLPPPAPAPLPPPAPVLQAPNKVPYNSYKAVEYVPDPARPPTTVLDPPKPKADPPKPKAEKAPKPQKKPKKPKKKVPGMGMANVPANPIIVDQQPARVDDASTQKFIRTGTRRKSITINGKSYSGKDLAALFGARNKDKGWVDALVQNPSLLIDCWQVVLDDPDQYKEDTGIQGKFWALKSNSDMEDFAGVFEKLAGGDLPRSWKSYVKDNFSRLLNENGLPSSSDGAFQWGPAYTFHIARKKIFALGDDAVKRIWQGGQNGAGARYVRYWLVGEYMFMKPLKAGDKTITLTVNARWATKVNREVATRLRDNNSKCEFPVGFAVGWGGGGGGTASYHATWDLVTIINNVFDGAGQSAFDLIQDPVMRRRIGSAFEILDRNIKSGANDFSGYPEKGDGKEGSKEGWRKSCTQEMPRAGVQYILRNFGRL